MVHRILKLGEIRIELNRKSAGAGYRPGNRQKRSTREVPLRGRSRGTNQAAAVPTAFLAKPKIFDTGNAFCIPGQRLNRSTHS